MRERIGRSVDLLYLDGSTLWLSPLRNVARDAGFEFSTAYADSAMIFGRWLVVDRLFAPRAYWGNCIRASRTSPLWLTMTDYFVSVRPRPAWASL